MFAHRLIVFALLSLVAFVAAADVEERGLPTSVVKVIHILETLYTAQAWCSSYVHCPKYISTVTRTTTHTTTSTVKAPLKTVTVTNLGCTSTETFTFNIITTTGPAVTATAITTDTTSVILTFGGPFIEDKKMKKRGSLPDPRLHSYSAKCISSACWYILSHGHLVTKTVLKTHYTTKFTIVSRTKTLTESDCTNVDVALLNDATITVPSSIIPGKGFHTVTSVTTETVPYYCYSAGFGIGCVPSVPTPCCDGICIDTQVPGGPNPVCAFSDFTFASTSTV